MNKHKDKLKFYFLLLIVTAGLVGLLFYAKYSGILNHMTSVESFKSYIEGHGQKAYIIFFIIQFMSVIIAPIPSNISAVAGGMMFGMWGWGIISLLIVLIVKNGDKIEDKFISIVKLAK